MSPCMGGSRGQSVVGWSKSFSRTLLGAVAVELAVKGLRLDDQGRANRGGQGAVLVHPARDVGVGQQVYLLPGLEERACMRAVALRHAAVGDQEVERSRQLGRLVEV